ncbi:hypothetical protein ACQSFC_25260 [Salmonella enterica]|uniref:hypothetical protein n=1 Tax=Salmonella enterica TaxID=28901 RepID=UPI003D315CFA
MAQLLQGPTHFCDLLSGNNCDFNINELPIDVQAALSGAGVDLFYVMTGGCRLLNSRHLSMRFQFCQQLCKMNCANRFVGFPQVLRIKWIKYER